MYLTSPPSILLLTAILLFAVQWQTIYSLLAYWWDSFTYGHGLLIVPLSIYLIWRKRKQFRLCVSQPSVFGLILFIALNVLWWFAYIIDIQFIQQVSVLVMFPALFWTLLGGKTTIKFLFPLLLPIIALPIWGPLETILQYITTQAVSFGLYLVGVPTYVENHYINIPEGKFSIEDVCAGLRYLLAALTISLVYVHLYLKEKKHTFAFLTAAIVLSMAVNWIRVFTVILAGHLTNMTHTFVKDHADFGWWLFAFTLIPIFWFGNYLANKENVLARGKEKSIKQNGDAIEQQQKSANFFIPAIVIIIAVTLPLSGILLKEKSKFKLNESAKNLRPPSSLLGWRGPGKILQDNLQPRFDSADAQLMVSYTKDGIQTLLFLAKYGYQEQGKELIAWDNRLYDEKFWAKVANSQRTYELNDKDSIKIEETIIRNPLGETRILWHWYSVAGINTVKPVIAKTLIAKDLISQNNYGSSIVLIAVDVKNTIEESRQILLDFTKELRKSTNIKYNGFT